MSWKSEFFSKVGKLTKSTRQQIFRLGLAAVLFLAFIAGAFWQQTTPTRQQKKPPHICTFEKVSAPFKFYDGEGYYLLRDGKEEWLEILPVSQEWDIYLALESSISYVLKPNKEHSLNHIYATGQLSKCAHKIIRPNAGMPTSKYYGHPVEDYVKKRHYFALEGWYVTTPFLERQEIKDSEDSRLVKRTALKLTDFNLHHLAEKKISFTQSDLKRYLR